MKALQSRNNRIRQSLAVLLLAGILLAAVPAWCWDENWTHAQSGDGDIIYNPKSSHGDAGTDERPQKFFIPPPRDARDVDPEELHDYFSRYRKEYAPYALARITRSIRYNGIMIPKGYYLIKPGDETDGSERVNLKSEAGMAPVAYSITSQYTAKPYQAAQARHRWRQPPSGAMQPAAPSETDAQVGTEKPDPIEGALAVSYGDTMYQRTDSPAYIIREAQSRTPQSAGTWGNDEVSLRLQRATENTQAVSTLPPAKNPDRQKPGMNPPPYGVFVVKQLGKVVAVIPIHRVEPYKPKRKEHIPRQALAWVEEENRHPVLKFYYRHKIYSTDFQ